MPKKRLPLADEEGEAPELTREDFKGMRPVRKVHPELIVAMKALAERNRGGRPKVAAPKEHISFRLAADVVASIKATGRGYNARVEEALRAAFVKNERKGVGRASKG